MLFLVSGLAGFLHEVFVYQGEERPSVLIVSAAMMGLPLYLRQNGK